MLPCQLVKGSTVANVDSSDELIVDTFSFEFDTDTM